MVFEMMYIAKCTLMISTFSKIPSFGFHRRRKKVLLCVLVCTFKSLVHTAILALIFTRRQFCRQIPEIRGKSVLVHVSDNRIVYQRSKRSAYASPTYLVCSVKYILNGSHISDDLQPMRAQDTGERKIQGEES